MKAMIEKEKEVDSGIMKFPNIEEEIVSVIKNMKNERATGVDGISAELMKLLIKDD